MQTRNAVAVIHFSFNPEEIIEELKELRAYILTDVGTRIVKIERRSWTLAHELIDAEIEYIMGKFSGIIEQIEN